MRSGGFWKCEHTLDTVKYALDLNEPHDELSGRLYTEKFQEDTNIFEVYEEPEVRVKLM